MKPISFLLLLTSLLSACAAPKYNATPISNDLASKKPNIVLVRDPATKEKFLNVMTAWLQQNGYSYQIQSLGSDHAQEKLTLTYNGRWNWDTVFFLTEARIEAFHQGQRVGNVNYQAPNNLNLNKLTDSSERIKGMLEVLFGKISAKEATRAIYSSNDE